MPLGCPGVQGELRSKRGCPGGYKVNCAAREGALGYKVNCAAREGALGYKVNAVAHDSALRSPSATIPLINWLYMNGTKLNRLFLCRAEFIRSLAVGGYPHCGYIRDDKWYGNMVGRINSTPQLVKWNGTYLSRIVERWISVFCVIHQALRNNTRPFLMSACRHVRWITAQTACLIHPSMNIEPPK